MSVVNELDFELCSLEDKSIAVLKKCKNLTTLSLSNNFQLTGKHIKELTTVESLCLSFCVNITPAYLAKIIENLKDLEYLDIDECFGLNGTCIDKIVENLHKLEMIRLSSEEVRIDRLVHLPNLKHLHLCNERSFGNEDKEFFEALAKHRADHLETLVVRAENCLNSVKCAYIGELKKLKELTCPNNDDIDDKCLDHISQLKELELLNIESCQGFTAKGLLKLIERSHKLSTLNVSYCGQFNEKFVQEVLNLLRQGRILRQSKKPLTITACESGITSFAVNTTREQFVQYFKEFGDVAGVRLLNNRTKKSSRHLIGFINYKDPTSAAIACQFPQHVLNGRRILVEPSNSWHQPHVHHSDVANAQYNDDISILNLTDDCLMKIFQHLAIREQVNLAYCCSRLKDVFAMHAKIQYKILSPLNLEPLTLWQIRKFLKVAGPYVEKLVDGVPYNHNAQIFELLGRHCQSVKSITLNNRNITKNNIWNLLRSMTMVNELSLNFCNLKDNCIPVLRNLKNLKTLSLDDNYALTGNHIHCLTTVECLSLSECSGITRVHLKKIFENLKDLQYLDIFECSRLSVACIEQIVENLQKLETIGLSSEEVRIDGLVHLPNLKHLHLFNPNSYGSEDRKFFEALAAHRADHLETFAVYVYNCLNQERCACIGKLKKLKKLSCPNNDDLDDMCMRHISLLQELELLNISNCKSFSANALINLIQTCRKLSTLIISHCPQLNEEFATKLLELLKAERKLIQPRKPLQIIAHQTSLISFVANNFSFLSAKDLVLITNDFGCDVLNIPLY